MTEKFILTQTRVGAQFAQSLKYEVHQDATLDRLIHQITGYVLTEHLQSTRQTVEQSAPATWWDHWKFDHPTWARRLRMKQPEFTTITQYLTFTREAIYPQANMAVPDLGRPVILERIEAS